MYTPILPGDSLNTAGSLPNSDLKQRRPNQPETSLEAYESVKPRIYETKARVLALFDVYGPLNDYDLCRVYGETFGRLHPITDQGLRSPRAELVAGGYLERTGCKLTPYNRSSYVHSITDTGRDKVRRDLIPARVSFEGEVGA